MKKITLTILAVTMGAGLVFTSCASTQNKSSGEFTMTEEKLNLTKEWDKTFPKSDKVDHKKVTFHNRYGITLAADMYTPKGVAEGTKLPAIAVSGPYGAVKEQSSGFYAQHMAEAGYLTIAFDPSFTGESGGAVRDTSDPAINSEDFSAAVDFLSVQENADPEKIGIIGICGWGGFALNTAAMDTRIKATLISTMYDMTRVTPYGYYDTTTEDQRYAQKQSLAIARTADYKNGTYSKPDASASANMDPEKLPQFLKDYMAYYAPGIGRAYHPRAVNFSRGWVNTATWNLYNMPILQYTKEIRSPVLMIHGQNAHSLYFSQDAYKNMTSGSGEKWAANKELYVVPNANHCDLYDGGVNADKIPWAKVEEFFAANLK